MSSDGPAVVGASHNWGMTQVLHASNNKHLTISTALVRAQLPRALAPPWLPCRRARKAASSQRKRCGMLSRGKRSTQVRQSVAKPRQEAGLLTGPAREHPARNKGLEEAFHAMLLEAGAGPFILMWLPSGRDTENCQR